MGQADNQDPPAAEPGDPVEATPEAPEATTPETPVETQGDTIPPTVEVSLKAEMVDLSALEAALEGPEAAAEPAPAAAPLPKGTPAPLVTFTPGTLVSDRYEILRRIGEGGMGAVYEARQVYMGHQVAFKILKPGIIVNEESLHRFSREVRAITRIRHRNVIQIYDAGRTDEGLHYMAMEFVDGPTLKEYLQEHDRTVPVEKAVAITAQILEAIREAHRLGFMHRDLKTANILIGTEEGTNEQIVKVMDFGLVKVLAELAPDGEALEAAGKTFHTRQGVITGTPQYMSPEQAAGRAMDHRTDLYSIGIILYEMLTGRLPFDATTPLGFLGLHIARPPMPFAERCPDRQIPAHLEQVVMKALAKAPGDRFGSADKFLEALKHVERGPGPVKTPVRPPASATESSREPQAVGCLVFLLAFLPFSLG